jgi:hypothetical protein
MKGDFAWDTVTSGIVSHHHTVAAGGHAARDPTNQRKSMPPSASILSTPASPVTHRIEEVARMTLLSRHCDGCNEERLFEQFHAEPASCPDVPDDDCPEWACTVCSDALIIGLPLREYVSSDRTTRAA